MPNMNDHVPEWWYVEGGDPFLAQIVRADDVIDDHLYNYAFLGLTQQQAFETARNVERARLDYELALLDSWYAKESPR